MFVSLRASLCGILLLLATLPACTPIQLQPTDPQLEAVRQTLTKQFGYADIRLHRASATVVEYDSLDAPWSKLDPDKRQQQAKEIAKVIYRLAPNRDQLEHVGVDFMERVKKLNVFHSQRTDSYTYSSLELKMEAVDSKPMPPLSPLVPTASRP